MADNYLERRMEEYRSARHTLPKKTIAARRPNELRVEFPPLRAVVTGGAHGIGRACVKALREVDCMVAFCDTDSKSGSITAQKLGARFYPVDVRNRETFKTFLGDVTGRWGDIDVVVNNVGISRFVPLEEMSDEDWDDVMSTNLQPVIETAKFIACHRNKSGLKGGSIINIASTRAFQSEPGTTAYSASKGGVYALTHSLMASLSRYGITVNCVAPGWINVNDESVTEADRAMHPSGRIGTPEDVARIVRFLAHPANNFINGAVITADGGMTRKMIYD